MHLSHMLSSDFSIQRKMNFLALPHRVLAERNTNTFGPEENQGIFARFFQILNPFCFLTNLWT